MSCWHRVAPNLSLLKDKHDGLHVGLLNRSLCYRRFNSQSTDTSGEQSGLTACPSVAPPPLDWNDVRVHPDIKIAPILWTRSGVNCMGVLGRALVLGVVRFIDDPIQHAAEAVHQLPPRVWAVRRARLVGRRATRQP